MSSHTPALQTSVQRRSRARNIRPATDGWPADEAAAYDKLWIKLRKATGAVQSHKWWDTCASEGSKGAALVAARMALKPTDGAVPLKQTDAETACLTRSPRARRLS